MSELCVISCSGLLAKWSHLSGKKAVAAAGTKLTPAVWDCGESGKHDPQLAFKPSSRYSIQQWPTAAPCSQRHRIDTPDNSWWKAKARFYCIVPTTISTTKVPQSNCRVESFGTQKWVFIRFFFLICLHWFVKVADFWLKTVFAWAFRQQ